MISLEKLRTLALALPEAKEAPHFEKISFRVKNRIFAAVDPKSNIVTLKFDQNDQDFFCSASKGAAYPVDNKWGQQGWTSVDMKSVNLALFKDMIIISYCGAASKKLAELARKSLSSK